MRPAIASRVESGLKMSRCNMTQRELIDISRKMKELDKSDADGSGNIDRDELRRLLETLGEELTEDDLEMAFEELDEDGSGEVEFFEFVKWFTLPEDSDGSENQDAIDDLLLSLMLHE
ncbi:hypothetical protein FOL47_006764 [Perkinsus chesapeaki]|uniref:EF-hand domain-containing protein n=1 Tax=Perkinsus chesapeaki TaxID=330153 RepID=A0A7J6LPX6_PERCH|nr:hypothetical protein FOL47_006764 [Perkinsus chesapeaki]